MKLYIDKLLLGIVALIMLAMMSLTFADVVGRYVFRAPIPGAVELIQFLMPLLIFSALPVITREEQHIVVTLLDSRLSAAVRWRQKLFVLLGSALVLAFLGAELFAQGRELQLGGNRSGFLGLPLAPVPYVMSLLCLATFLVLLQRTSHHVSSRKTWRK